MTRNSDLAIGVLTALRAGCDAYLDILDAGVADAEADDLMRSLLGVNLTTLTSDEAARFGASCAALASARTRRLAEGMAGPGLDGARVVTDALTAYAPTAARNTAATVQDGLPTPWVSWLDYTRNEGDQVIVDGPGLEVPVCVGPNASVINRHVIAGDGEQAWLLTSRAEAGQWILEAVHVAAGRADAPELVASAHAVNPEIWMATDGTVHVVFQGLVDGRFVVMHAERASTGWSTPVSVSPADETAWDPSVAVSDGTVTVAWSTYRDGRFRLAVRQRVAGAWGEEQTAPMGRDGHALHACVSVGAQPGTWWLATDLIAAETLASSGRTAAVEATALRASGTHGLIPAYDLTTRVEVLRLDADGWSRPAGAVVDERSSGSYPRVVEDGSGTLWLGYRTLRQLPFRHYVSHVAVRVHDGEEWSEPTIAPVSDGTNAEFSLFATHKGVAAAYHGDQHHARYRAMMADPIRAQRDLTDDEQESVRREHLMIPAIDRMSTGGHLGHGQVRVAEFTTDRPGPPSLVAVEALQPVVDVPRHAPAGWPPPPEPGEPESQLWWGDLHRHSNISRCGAGLDIGVDDHYRLAEDVLGCDFWALTDHAENTSDLNWHHLRKLANAFYRPGSHVPLIGFEWTSFTAGHMNVIYAGDDGPLFSSSDPETATPDGLWQALEDYEALTIPHHPSALVYATDWSYRSERFLRVAEVFQAATGSYESPWSPRQYHDAVAPGASVHEALAAGHRLGLIASTDHRSGAAFVGLYAPSLDRAAVHAALTDRRCFGATRRGIVPHLRIGAGWPGQSLPLAEVQGTEISFGGLGIADLSAVQLLRDGEIVADARAGARAEGLPSDELAVPLDIRMLSHEGGAREWSGSVRISAHGRIDDATHWAPEVTRVESDAVHWEVDLPARYGGRFLAPGVLSLGVTLRGRADCVVEIVAGERRIAATLGELAALTGPHSLTDATDLEELALRSGVGGYGSLGTRRWEGTAPTGLLRAGSWYAVRVIQSDGEMAWSSPVWID